MIICQNGYLPSSILALRGSGGSQKIIHLGRVGTLLADHNFVALSLLLKSAVAVGGMAPCQSPHRWATTLHRSRHSRKIVRVGHTLRRTIRMSLAGVLFI